LWVNAVLRAITRNPGESHEAGRQLLGENIGEVLLRGIAPRLAKGSTTIDSGGTADPVWSATMALRQYHASAPRTRITAAIGDGDDRAR